MQQLGELIKTLCPDGVEYKDLGEVLSYEQPSKYIVSSTDYKDEYTTPVLTAGQTFILGYTNEQNGIYKASKEYPVIIFDDFTTSFHWVEFDFKVKSSAMKMLRPKDEKCVFKYLYYVMQTIKYSPVDHTRQWIEKYSKFIIPVPPIEVQREIVRILDNFTELSAELTAELTARKKQYGYYRDVLLSVESRIKNIEWKKLGDLLDYIQPTQYIVKDANYSDNYITPVLTAGQSFILGYTNEIDNIYNATPVNPVIIFDDFTTSIQWVDFSFKVKSSAMKLLKPKNNYNLRYIFYAMKCIKYDTVEHSRQWISKYSQIEIPYPPLEEQNRIVAILDRFDKLCNDISQGLPAEIEARKKQYEYYRDKLLTFKPITLDLQ